MPRVYLGLFGVIWGYLGVSGGGDGEEEEGTGVPVGNPKRNTLSS